MVIPARPTEKYGAGPTKIMFAAILLARITDMQAARDVHSYNGKPEHRHHRSQISLTVSPPWKTKAINLGGKPTSSVLGAEPPPYPAAAGNLSSKKIISCPVIIPQFCTGMLHFLVISCIDRYTDFLTASSVG